MCIVARGRGVEQYAGLPGPAAQQRRQPTVGVLSRTGPAAQHNSPSVSCAAQPLHQSVAVKD